MFYLPFSSILDLKKLSFFSIRQLKCALSISLYLTMSMVAAEEPLITLPSLDITSTNEDTSEDLPKYSDYSAEDIENTGAISTSDFLNKQGALQVRSNSSSQNQTSISLRGFGANAANNSLIIVNGIPLASFSHVPPSLNSIPLNSIDSINLYLGSYGSLYGDQAVGGVIDIETTIPDKQSREITLGLGNQQQRQASFFWSKTLDDNNAFQFSGEHFQSGHFQPHNLQNNIQVNGGWLYRAEKHKVFINLNFYQTRIELPQSLIWQQSTAEITSDNFTNLKTYTAQISHRYQINADWTFKQFLLIQKENSNGKVGIDFTSAQDNIFAKWQWHYQKKWLGGFQTQLQHYKLNNQRLNDKVQAGTHALFSRYSHAVNERLEIAIGSRFAWQNLVAYPSGQTSQATHDKVWVNEQSLTYHLTPKVDLYLRRDLNFRLAKANEKIWDPENIRSLKPQKGISYETGLTWNNDGNQGSIGIFSLLLDNEINFDPIPTASAPFGRMHNLPQTQRMGLQSSTSNQLLSQLKLQTQLVYVKGWFTQSPLNNKSIPGMSPLTASLNLNYDFSDTAHINFNQTFSSTSYANYDLLNQGAKMPAIWISSLFISKQYQNINFNMQIENLFNKKNPRFASFSPLSQTIRYYPNDGRRILLSASIKV